MRFEPKHRTGGPSFEEEGAVMKTGELEEAEAFAHWPAGSDGDKGSLIRESLCTVRRENTATPLPLM